MPIIGRRRPQHLLASCFACALAVNRFVEVIPVWRWAILGMLPRRLPQSVRLPQFGDFLLGLVLRDSMVRRSPSGISVSVQMLNLDQFSYCWIPVAWAICGPTVRCPAWISEQRIEFFQPSLSRSAARRQRQQHFVSWPTCGVRVCPKRGQIIFLLGGFGGLFAGFASSFLLRSLGGEPGQPQPFRGCLRVLFIGTPLVRASNAQTKIFWRGSGAAGCAGCGGVGVGGFGRGQPGRATISSA